MSDSPDHRPTAKHFIEDDIWKDGIKKDVLADFGRQWAYNDTIKDTVKGIAHHPEEAAIDAGAALGTIVFPPLAIVDGADLVAHLTGTTKGLDHAVDVPVDAVKWTALHIGHGVKEGTKDAIHGVEYAGMHLGHAGKIAGLNIGHTVKHLGDKLGKPVVHAVEHAGKYVLHNVESQVDEAKKHRQRRRTLLQLVS